MSVCFICEGRISAGIGATKVKQKGVLTFIQKSKLRKDGKHVGLANVSSILVHDKCRKAYSKANYTPRIEVGGDPSRTSRSVSEAFNFKMNCLFCGEDASVDYVTKDLKKPKLIRNVIREVRSKDFSKSIMQLVKTRNDKWGAEIKLRIGHINDLIAADGRYHDNCSKRFFKNQVSTHMRAARPETDEVSACVSFICKHLEENEQDCQFTLEDILENYDSYIPETKTIQRKLNEVYGPDLLFMGKNNQYRKTMLCFRNTGNTILSDFFYENRKKDAKEERNRIVETAADIVLEDIRSKIYELETYPPSDKFLDKVNEDKIICPKKNKDNSKLKRKVSFIAHCIIAAVRPRSFVSSLQLALGTLLYRKYGSRDLVEVLSAAGCCSSYTDIRQFEVSSMQKTIQLPQDNSFFQFVFDNADVNIDTIDGRNTFHAMGGIQCVTPLSSVFDGEPIRKLKTVPTAFELGKFGTIPLVPFQKKEGGLSKILVQDINYKFSPNKAELPNDELLWMYGKWKAVENIPGWNGFMQAVHSNRDYSTSRILCVPFVNSPPSSYDTIYTVLLSAVENCKSHNMKSCIVTFDQPLYIKARDIIASCGPDLGSVIVCLGGFHTLMSFMGAIGYIMDGSGLQELCVIYATTSTSKMMTGHSYSRTLRGHILVHLTLAQIILSNFNLTEEEHSALTVMLNDSNLQTLDVDVPLLKAVAEKFFHKLEEIAQNGGTSRLWIQYFKTVTIIKNFVRAERSGNWELHLKSVKDMLPYFHASGHYLYAKSCHLYLQDMIELESKLTPEEYELFIIKGWFTIRRSEKFWSGIWSDMTIEQTLMRSLKSTGGLTHGRGVGDSTLGRWIASMPTTVDIIDQVEQYCGVSFATTEQHVDARNSRIQRDTDDVKKLYNWFMIHDPFPVGEAIMSISTGIVGDENINCHNADEIGTACNSKIIGGNFGSVKYQRKNRVIPLKTMTSQIKVHDKQVPVNAEMIFRRIAFHKKSNEELKRYFQHELAPYPLSLFDDVGMRKTQKSVFYKLFDSRKEPIDFQTTQFVIDGGFLLHRVVWETNEAVSSIITKYVKYIKHWYGKGAIIEFHGYPDAACDKNTKSSERLRRAITKSAPQVTVEEGTSITLSKEVFLSNEQNKKCLISLLVSRLETEDFKVRQAAEYADHLIVASAVEVAQQSHECVVIFGEDTDLLVILTASPPMCTNIFLLKPGKGKQDDVVYSPLHYKFSSVSKNNILFLHAFSGCDTTSSFFGKGKLKFLKTLEMNSNLLKVAEVFSKSNATADEVDEAGKKCIAALYGDDSKQLNVLRYEMFEKLLSKTSFNLASLPPTEAAARQHSLRTYLQVQAWKNNPLNPLQWGWKTGNLGLRPVTTTEEVAPY